MDGLKSDGIYSEKNRTPGSFLCSVSSDDAIQWNYCERALAEIHAGREYYAQLIVKPSLTSSPWILPYPQRESHEQGGE